MPTRSLNPLYAVLIAGFLVITLFPGVSLFGQMKGSLEVRANVTDFPFSVTSYGIQQNIPQSQIIDFVKMGKTGELIFSTANGVIRFNGYEFKNYQDNVAYRRAIFNKLFYCDHSQELYGHEIAGKLSRLEQKLQYIGDYGAVDIRDPYHAKIDSAGVLTFEHHQQKRARVFATGIQNADFIYVMSDDVCLVSASKKGYLVSLRDGKAKQIAEDSWLNATQEEDSGATIAISHQKVYRIFRGMVQELALALEPNPMFTDVAVVNDLLLVTSRKGMYVYEPSGTTTFYSEKDVFPTNLLFCLYFDRYEGCLFVGSSTRGLLKLVPKRCWSNYKNETAYQNSFGAMVAGAPGEIFVNANIYLNRFSSGKLKQFQRSDGYAGLARFGDTIAGLTWWGEIQGYSLNAMNPLFKIKLLDGGIFSAFRDRKGIFWIGTEKGVFSGKDLSQLKPFLPTAIQNKITTFLEDSKGRLWLGGSHGIYVIDRDRKPVMQFREGPIAEAIDVRAIYEDKSGKIWIGTYGAGLFCYTGNRLIALSELENYHLGSDVFTLGRDKLGFILMSSNNGLRVLHEDALNNFIEGKSSYLIPFYVGVHSGIYNPEFNGGFHNNFASEKDSLFYFPGIQGYVKYVSKGFPQRTNRLIFSDIYLDGELVKNPFRIKREVKFIRFEFFDVNFSETQNLFYQYKLQDRSGTEVWSKLQKEPFVTFSHLGPGNYRLVVRALDGYNSLNPPVISYEFFIVPYFYETITFYAVLLAGIGFFIFYNVERRHRRKRREISRELEIRNIVTEMKLRAIQSQMNPHFLFNTLNTLVNLISSGHLKKAEKYAIALSKLLRRFLEQSGKHFIPLREEINTLQNFMEIQQERYHFTFRIECPSELNDYFIPTSLLQPLVENALIHGIAHLIENDGVIMIEFKPFESGGIQIDLWDNGIGFKKSAEINEGSKRQSFGLEMVKQKIDLLRKRYQVIAEMEITDLESENQTGTHICLRLRNTTAVSGDIHSAIQPKASAYD